MFGKVREAPQNEDTPFYPRSPYGISKLCGFELTRNYRESYNLFCCSGILFNHESPKRGYEFVTRKITLAVARIKKGLQKKIILGNINSKRDWGHAKDYVRAMWLILQQKKPADFVVGTGKQYSVKDFLKMAFKFAGLNYKKYLKIDKSYYRPADVENLISDSKKARRKLKWKPTVTFKELVEEMVLEDLKNIK